MLMERIESLNDLGLYNLWMKPDGYECYSAATILGYTCDDWDLIKKYYKKNKDNGGYKEVEYNFAFVQIPTTQNDTIGCFRKAYEILIKNNKILPYV